LKPFIVGLFAQVISRSSTLANMTYDKDFLFYFTSLISYLN